MQNNYEKKTTHSYIIVYKQKKLKKSKKQKINYSLIDYCRFCALGLAFVTLLSHSILVYSNAQKHMKIREKKNSKNL
jgi:hypothetical protein